MSIYILLSQKPFANIKKRKHDCTSHTPLVTTCCYNDVSNCKIGRSCFSVISHSRSSKTVAIIDFRFLFFYLKLQESLRRSFTNNLINWYWLVQWPSVTSPAITTRDRILGSARGLRFVDLNLTSRVFLRVLRFSSLCKFNFHAII